MQRTMSWIDEVDMSTQSASLMNFIKEQSKANYMDIDFEVDDYQSRVKLYCKLCDFVLWILLFD